MLPRKRFDLSEDRRVPCRQAMKNQLDHGRRRAEKGFCGNTRISKLPRDGLRHSPGSQELRIIDVQQRLRRRELRCGFDNSSTELLSVSLPGFDALILQP